MVPSPHTSSPLGAPSRTLWFSESPEVTLRALRRKRSYEGALWLRRPVFWGEAHRPRITQVSVFTLTNCSSLSHRNEVFSLIKITNNDKRFIDNCQ